MKNKFLRVLLIVLVLLVVIIVAFVVWGLPNSMGSIEPFLNFGDIFRRDDGGETPGKPAYYQFGLDCDTGSLVKPGELIQPEFACDDWRINRYERPFNAGTQDKYHPDLDIQYAYLGRDADWYYLRVALYDAQPGSEFLAGTYAMEMDLDVDGRGDLLVLVFGPGKDAGSEWSKEGVQIWADTNNDVGGLVPNFPEDAVVADGYDTLIFDQGNGDNPNGAWARAFLTGSAYVELAFRTDYLKGDLDFKWWVWAGYRNYTPAMFEFHDFFSHEKAGDANEGMDFFPIKEFFAVDSSCANMWGSSPNFTDPDFCLDLDLQEPVDDTCCILKLIIPLFPCRFPGDKPGDNPCVLAFKDWVALVWQPEHPGQNPSDNEEKLWQEYEEYLKDPFCPPDDGTDDDTDDDDTPTKPPPDETQPPGDDDDDDDVPIVTVELTEEPGGEEPDDTPTPTGYVPPPPLCARGYSKKKCLEAGGTWVVVDGGTDPTGRPLPNIEYCDCP